MKIESALQRVRSAPQDPEAHKELAVGLEEAGRFRDAAREWQQFSVSAPQDSLADQIEAARAFTRLMVDDKALPAWQRVVALDSQNVEGVLELSRYLARAGRYEEAHDAMALARQLDPQNEGILEMFDFQKPASGKWPKARAA